MNNSPRLKTILILAANPTSTSRLRLDEEVREIDEGLRRANKREQFKLEQKWAVRKRDFYRAILDYQPQIVHFSGHGAGEDGIVLQDETEQLVLVKADALASMFKLFATKGVECVLLNACYSEVQAKAISQYVNYVIGMNRTVGDKAAVAFSVAFYDALAAGEQMEFAYELGCSQMFSFLEQQTPVLLKKDLLSIIPIQPEVDILPPNPYQGLAAFAEVDAAFFFGRETFVNGLVEAVNKQPLVAVIGPSGSGKSSVVYAGLIPQLRIAGNWLIESFRPGNQPFYQLASALVRQLEPAAGETAQLREAVGLTADMQQGKITLQQVISRLVERHSGKRLLLFADQFEELYTLCQDKQEIERFADALLEAVNQDNLTLVLTLRADFYGFVLGYRPFRDALQQFMPQLLSSMNREELQRAIEQPAQKLEVQLEGQLTQRILDDVGNEPGNLPLLEFALTRLWSLQQRRLLTHARYDEIGGVKKALANHAEQIYQQLNPTQQKQAQRIFVQLVRPGEGTEDTRGIATRAEVGDENWGLVSYLAGYTARLVVTGRDDKSGEDTVEVVHEALIREWLTLREWMNANRQFRVWQERLKVAMLEWKNSNHDSGALLRGVSLGVAEDWLHKRAEEMTQQERDFISAGVQQRDSEREEQERKQRHSRNALIAGLVGALSLSGFAFWQWQQAEKTHLAQSEAIGRYSDALFNQNRDFDALIESLRVAVALHKRKANVPIVQAALRQAVYRVREHNRLEGKTDGDGVWSVAFSPDGKTIATGSSDKTVRLWNLNGQPLQTLKGHTNGVTSVAFSPDGKTIASGSYDSTVRLWNLNGQLLQTLKTKGATSIAFSSDGKTIATASNGDGTVRLWNLNGQLLQTLKGHTQGVESVVFSPDGKTVATGSSDKTVRLWNLNGQLLQTLKGHTKGVERVAFSPDGKTIASGSSDNTVRLWNVNGQLLQTLKGHTDIVTGVAFSSDGKTIATASYDETIRLWNLNGQLLQTFNDTKNKIFTLAFSPDGKTIASGGIWDNTVRLWNVNGQPLRTLKRHTNAVSNVAFSPDGKTIASSIYDNTIRLWNLNGKSQEKTLKGHTDAVSSVAFSPDGKIIATGSYDKTVRLWNVNGQPLQTLKGHTNAVTSVAFSPDSKTIASGSNDNTVRLWNLNGQLLQTFPSEREANKGHTNAITSVAFSPDGKTIATDSYDNTVRLWNLNGRLLQTFPSEREANKGHTKEVGSVAFSPDGKTIASGSDDNTVRLWNINGQLLQTLKGHTDIVTGVAFSPDGKTIVSSSDDGTVRLWSANGQLLQTLKDDTEPVPIRSVAFSPDGKTVASGSDDNTTQLWNLSGQQLQSSTNYALSDTNVAFSPDGKTIASGSYDNTVQLWNVNGEPLQTLKGHTELVRSIAFSPDSKTIASGSSDKTVRLWNVNGQPLQILKGHTDIVTGVAFSPDGKTIASGSSDKTVRLWNVNGQPLQTLKGHTELVSSVAFSPDGKTIASGSSDKTVRLWNVNGQPLQILKGHTSEVSSVAFSPDGKTIASTSADDNTIRLWNLDGQPLQTINSHIMYVNSVAFSPDGKTIIASGSGDNTIRLWDLNLDNLLVQGCTWLHDYLNNPSVNLSNDDRHLCDDISTGK